MVWAECSSDSHLWLTSYLLHWRLLIMGLCCDSHHTLLKGNKHLLETNWYAQLNVKTWCFSVVFMPVNEQKENNEMWQTFMYLKSCHWNTEQHLTYSGTWITECYCETANNMMIFRGNLTQMALVSMKWSHRYREGFESWISQKAQVAEDTFPICPTLYNLLWTRGE